MRHLLTAAAVCAVLALAGCGGDEVPDGTGPDPVTSSSAAPEPSPEEPATPTFTAPGDPAFARWPPTTPSTPPSPARRSTPTAPALAAAAPDEIADAAENLRVLGEVQLGLGTDGTADDLLQVAMTERGIVITLLDAFARVGGYIDTCEA